jgi:hypothetical protein
LWPTGCFFRLAYSESLFLFLAILSMYAMQRRWPLLSIAIIVGAATASRPVGVALLCPLTLYIWSRQATLKVRLIRLAWAAPIAVWGLGAFMLFQWAVFNDPLAFVQTHVNWRMRPPVPFFDKLTGLITLEPIWSVFTPSSPAYWRHLDPHGHPLFSLQAANPIFYGLAVVLVILGGWKRWLTRCELAWAIPLLLIPYLTNSYDMCMSGMGRFTGVVLPLYIVLGHLLSRLPVALASTLLTLAGLLLAIYAGLFACLQRII